MIEIFGVTEGDEYAAAKELERRLLNTWPDLARSKTDVVRMFVNEGVALTAIGLALGTIGALGLTRVMSGLLFGVTPTDASTFAAIAVSIGIVGFLACYVPARRAARVDPLVALRRG